MSTNGSGITLTPISTVDPCTVVIFGASGDLTRRKLVPALWDLACENCISKNFQVLGVSRSQISDEEFRKQAREAAQGSKDARNFDSVRWEEFEKRLHYMVGDINQKAFFKKLRTRLEEMDKKEGSQNWLFYVSTPASLAPPILEGLKAAGLNRNEKGWSRIVLEKPFGRDLESARELNQSVSEVFDEKDVFRIDHYLGKETVQNLLFFRFGNSMFEPVWNRNYIDYVEITAAEKLGVEGRGAFYEETGALRDMVANHMLQLVTLTAMEPPIAFDAASVREQKVQVLRSIRPMTQAEVAQRTVRGQYGPGRIDGKEVSGYREEQKVDANSHAETFVAVEFHINNWRWAGVPFFVRTGKRLPKQLTEIRIHFKRTPQTLFAATPDQEMMTNIITARIQPNEGISIHFAAKKPGSHMLPASVKMDFSYSKAFGTNTPVAYETLLLDVMRGDATLFTRRDEVEAEWAIITPIEEAWQNLHVPQFPNYAAGSEGPMEADALISGQCRAWRGLRDDSPAGDERKEVACELETQQQPA